MLTHDSGIKMLVKEDTKRKAPSQSMSFKTWSSFFTSSLILKNNIIKRKLIALKNSDNQKIQRCYIIRIIYRRSSEGQHTQDAFSEKTPPSIGPTTAPINQIKLISPTHFPRSLRETRSVKTTNVIVSKVPPPAPCMHRPTIRIVAL